ncbi:MAG: hypothetical protein OXE80_11310 [Gammaproteobacteria bacterium]|nr:hypothetical protein [Gammaproteobacteria bacterium]
MKVSLDEMMAELEPERRQRIEDSAAAVIVEQSERIPAADEYLRALGRATYNFAYLEQGIVHLMETLQPGFLKEASGKTAGQISNCFSKAVELLEDTQSCKVRLQTLAKYFIQIVDDRNSLMHGNPHTAQMGEQRLLYDDRHGRRDWTVESIVQFSSRTATASIEAGDLLHGGLLQHCRAANL